MHIICFLWATFGPESAGGHTCPGMIMSSCLTMGRDQERHPSGSEGGDMELCPETDSHNW